MDNIAVIAIITVFLMLSPFIANSFKSPISVVEILLGLAAANMGLIHHNKILEVMGEVGFLYLMFLAGSEVDLRQIFSLKRTVFKKALTYFFIMYALSLSAMLYLDLSPVYVVALPVLSVGMLMPLIKEYGKNDKWIQDALVIGIFGELISIVAFVVLNGYLKFGFGFELYKTLGILILFLTISALFFKLIKIIFWWFPELKLKIMPVIDSKDQDIRFSIAIFFIMISIMIHLDLELVLGTFLAGVFISTFFEHKVDLPEKLSAFGFGFLIPIFFIHIGTTLDLSEMMNEAVAMKILAITFFMLFMRIVAAFLVYFKEFGFKNTLLFSFSHSMPLTFLIAIASIGYQTQAISDTDYYAFIASAALEALLFMLIIKGLKNYFQNRETALRRIK